MAEALAVTAVALATPPGIKAALELVQKANIFVKIAAILHLSSHSQCTHLLSRIRHTINKSRTELQKGSDAMSPDAARDFEDKLNTTIDLYNQLVTSHSAANSKTRLDALKVAEKASTRLLQNIKTSSRKCADEKLAHAIKTCLYYDQHIKSPDGTLAAYQRDAANPRNSQLSSDATVPHSANGEQRSTQSSQVLLPISASEGVVSTSMGSPQRFYIPVEVHFVPHLLPPLSNPSPSPQPQQHTSTGHDFLGIPTAENDVPPIDLGSTRISEVVSAPEGDSS
ncbi:hypothetical protein DL96DRAFT_727274 [Flagelloscypha sp. PMI_526]|nr:hypothetical protein DL96DRAFT_727274 [Flagelloscypha sp. PMI_526]